MKITTIQYKKVFPIGAYQNEPLGIEATLDEGEDPIEAFKTLKQLAHEVHNTLNPQLYTETPIHNNSQWEVNTNTQEQPPSTPKTQPHSTIEAIKSCTTLKVLQEFDLIVKNMSNKYPEIKEAYDKKNLELSE